VPRRSMCEGVQSRRARQAILRPRPKTSAQEMRFKARAFALGVKRMARVASSDRKGIMG
jgi:hypothetical protein